MLRKRKKHEDVNEKGEVKRTEKSQDGSRVSVDLLPHFLA